MKFKALKDFSHSGVNIKQDQYFYPREVGFSKASLEFLEKKGKIYKVSDVENPDEDMEEKRRIPLVVMIDPNTIIQNVVTPNETKRLPSIQPIKPDDNMNNPNLYNNSENTESEETNEEYNKAAFKELMQTIEDKPFRFGGRGNKGQYNTKSNLKDLYKVAVENGLDVNKDMTRKDLFKILKDNNIY